VAATKVVHPGTPGQAVGCDTVSADGGDHPDEHAQECPFDAARSTPAGAADHGAWLDGGRGRGRRRSVDTAGVPLAGTRAGGAAALDDRSSAPRRCPHKIATARVAAIERLRRQRLSGPAIACRLAMPTATVGGILRRLGLGKRRALELPSRRWSAISANDRASSCTSTARSSGALWRSAIGSPAIGATPSAVRAGSRGGARSAAGDRRQPARSVLAPSPRTGHPRTGGEPMLEHLNNVLGNDR
jgi:hypothetical protein